MLHDLMLWLKTHWPRQEGTLVRQYREAFNARPDVLRDLAVFCRVNENVASGELERIEGRREVFRRIVAMKGLDPLQVTEFLEGENY